MNPDTPLEAHMVRVVALLLLSATVTLLGCDKKKDEAGGAATTGGTAAAPAANPAGGKAVNWEKVTRVPFARLQSILPETVIGMKRANLGGSTVPDGERTYSEGVGDYTGPNETTLSIIVRDHPVTAHESLSSKTTVFKGYPVVAENENSDEASMEIIVGERFVVQARGAKLKVAQLKSALEKVDLAKLDSWKSEGLK